MFLGPLEESKQWNYDSISGVQKLLKKISLLKITQENDSKQVLYDFYLMQKQIENDFESLKYNTSIAAVFIFMNKVESLSEKLFEKFLIVFSVFAPHLCEYLFARLKKNEESVFEQKWPELIEVDFEIQKKIILTINGKKKAVFDQHDCENQEQVENFINEYCKEKSINFKKMIFIERQEIFLINLI